MMIVAVVVRLALQLTVVSTVMIMPCSGFTNSGIVVHPKGQLSHVPHRHHQDSILHGRVIGSINFVPPLTGGVPRTKRTSSFTLRVEPSSDSIGSIQEEDTSSSSSSSSSSLSWSVPFPRPGLALVDFVSLIVFAGIGKASHAVGDGSVLDEVTGVTKTAFPFIVSWFATSFVTGVYEPLPSNSDDDESNSRNSWLVPTWKQMSKGWIVAIPLGCVGRGLIRGYPPPIPFVVVTMVATFVILGLARTAYNFIDVGAKKK